MKMTALVENKSDGTLGCEHGLSVYIEFNGRKLLLDTGTTGLYADNAGKLGIDLSLVDMAVLSHAHYDHSGGYEAFFAANTRAEVCLQATCLENCYKITGQERRYIGIPQGLLEKYPDRFRYVSGDMDLGNGIYLVAHHTPGLDQRGAWAGMCRLEDGHWVTDDFSHEQSLVLDTSEGLVIFNSCCHAGADVIIREVEAQFEGRPVHAIVGGFHLKDVMNRGDNGADQVRALGERLKAMAVPHIYTGHCTGSRAFAILKEVLGDRVHYFMTGDCVEL